MKGVRCCGRAHVESDAITTFSCWRRDLSSAPPRTPGTKKIPIKEKSCIIMLIKARHDLEAAVVCCGARDELIARQTWADRHEYRSVARYHFLTPQCCCMFIPGRASVFSWQMGKHGAGKDLRQVSYGGRAVRHSVQGSSSRIGQLSGGKREGKCARSCPIGTRFFF